MKFKEFLAERISDAPKELLPSRARLIDRVALIRIRDELEPWMDEIGRLALQFYPRARAVYRWIAVEGIERRPIVQHLAGERVRVVEHREYGWRLRLDIKRLMLCLGNSYERLRLARLVSPNETVIDMFAGVGQFTIPIAVLSKPRKIYAIEINPEAYDYLVENVTLNRVGKRVYAILGDCKEVVRERLKDAADRVVMGYLNGTIDALPHALEALNPMGGFIHFHELARRGREEELVERVEEEIGARGYKVKMKKWRKVKSYSKTRNHIVIDLWAVKE